MHSPPRRHRTKGPSHELDSYRQHFLRRDGGIVRRDRTRARRGPRGGGGDGRDRKATRVREHDFPHSFRRSRDDRNHGDLLPRRRSAAAVRQPPAEITMTIDWWTLGLQTVNIVILVWLLQRFFWAPIAGMLVERRAAAQKALADAQAARDSARAALADIQRTRAGFAAERDKILADARLESERAGA